jgi:hypothetical protein
MKKKIDIELHFDTIDYQGCYKYLLYLMYISVTYAVCYSLWSFTFPSVLTTAIMVYVCYQIIYKGKKCAYKIEFKSDYIRLSYAISEKSICYTYFDIEKIEYKVVSGESFALSNQIRIKFKNDKRNHHFVCSRDKYDEICQVYKEITRANSHFNT